MIDRYSARADIQSFLWDHPWVSDSMMLWTGEELQDRLSEQRRRLRGQLLSNSQNRQRCREASRRLINSSLKLLRRATAPATAAKVPPESPPRKPVIRFAVIRVRGEVRQILIDDLPLDVANALLERLSGQGLIVEKQAIDPPGSED